MRGACLDLIKTFIVTFLLGENSGENHYMLLAVLLYEEKHSSLINYLNLLLLDEIPILSSSTEELIYEERYFKNFISFETKNIFMTKFLFHFLRKENIKSLIILYNNSASAKKTISDIQARLKEETASVCRSEIYKVSGIANTTEFILQKIREHTFTTLTVIVSTNQTFSEFVADSLRQSKIPKIVFLYSKNRENYQPDGKVKNLVSIKAVNIRFGLFGKYILNALDKSSNILKSLSASSFKRRVAPKNFSTVFVNSIREEESFKNVKLKMIYNTKEIPKKIYGLYTIDRSGNETLNWYSNTTLWNETFNHSNNCLAGYYPIYKGADKCHWRDTGILLS